MLRPHHPHNTLAEAEMQAPTGEWFVGWAEAFLRHHRTRPGYPMTPAQRRLDAQYLNARTRARIEKERHRPLGRGGVFFLDFHAPGAVLYPRRGALGSMNPRAAMP